jgi:monofunctional biosynthetic peptidoglycan transglycosylase
MHAPSRTRSSIAAPRPGPRVQIPKGPLFPILLAFVIAVAAGLVALLLLPFFGAVGLSANALSDRLREAGASFTRMPHFPERSTIYAEDGSVLATIYLDENREIVHLDQIAPIAQKAVLAIEDDGFYQHGALNVPSVFRAIIANLIAGRITQGGSTITQQLVKNLFLSTNRSMLRKGVEFTLAPAAEWVLPKRRILELYMNVIEWGPGIYGADAAAEAWYGVSAQRLNREQAARLAALLPSPLRRKPARMNWYSAEIQRRMAQSGW